jgi:hypothetical protein
MPNFMTRVELHNGTAQDYQRLHDAMQARQFSRTITDSQNIRYHLPTAEYSSFGNIDTNGVLELAKAAVRAIGKTASIVTSETVNTFFNGLPRT